MIEGQSVARRRFLHLLPQGLGELRPQPGNNRKKRTLFNGRTQAFAQQKLLQRDGGAGGDVGLKIEQIIDFRAIEFLRVNSAVLLVVRNKEREPYLSAILLQ